MSDKPEWYEEALAILGPKGITDDESEVSPWLTDWRGRYTGKAAAMFSPASTAEVAGIVRNWQTAANWHWFPKVAIAEWLGALHPMKPGTPRYYRCGV